MVAPFLGPLKAWIKTQKKLDRQRAQAGSHLVPPPPTGVTDTEGLEADLGETTADESALPEMRSHDAKFAALVANLGRGHRTSETLPEVSTHTQIPEVADPALELKRLLSVGLGFPSQPQPNEAPQSFQEPSPNPLLAMLHGNNRRAPAQQNMPHTPFEQIRPTPQLPQSPHGQHHPRQPHLGQMQPPPPFQANHQQGGPFHGQQHSHVPPQHHNGYPRLPTNQFIPPPPRHTDPVFQDAQQSLNASAPPPYMRTGDPQFTQPPQFPGSHGHAIPPASKLPPPKLTTHTLGLLNAFKMNEKPGVSSPVGQMLPPNSQTASTVTRAQPSQHSLPYAPSPPTFQSPPPVDNFEPVQPKPRNAHQDSLLSLFRSPSMAEATLAPAKTPEPPVELSANPLTPGIVKMKPAAEAGPPVPNLNAKPNLLDLFGVQPKPGLTSATVHGPVNAPDFETVKKNAHAPLNGSSHGPSSVQIKPEQKTFIPQQVLRGDGSVPRPTAPAVEQSRSSNASPTTVPFNPKILKRPQQEPGLRSSAHTQGLLDMFKSVSPQPPAVPIPVPTAQPQAPAHAENLLHLFKNQASHQPQVVPPPAPLSRSPAPVAQVSISSSANRKSSQSMEQKNTLLSLFGKSSASITASPVQASIIPLPLSGTPIPPARSPQPPTPKTYMSGVISPVSPLPGSQTDSPAQINSRSRISSIGDAIPPHVVIPQTSAPTSYPQMPLLQQSNGYESLMGSGVISPPTAAMSELGIGLDKGKGKVGTEGGKSPVDKTFLLGFLNDVARKGR